MSELAHNPADGAGGSVSARRARGTPHRQAGLLYLYLYLSMVPRAGRVELDRHALAPAWGRRPRCIVGARPPNKVRGYRC